MSVPSRHILRTLVSSRSFHVSSRLNIDPKTVEEVRIPVPWGHIAGKWWGSKDKQPILAIHGWLDNAGTWDPVAKKLPDDYSLLAIDCPGTGLSSHLPQFQTYSFFCASVLIQRIKKHFSFENLSLLGHSGGSAMCFLYATLFPEYVNSYFGIDYLIYAYNNELKRAERVGKLMDTKIMLAFRDPSKANTYTEEEAANTWVTATKGSVSKQSAEILMKRGVARVANGKVVFTRDNRLKKVPDLSAINTAQAYTLADNIRCNVCIVKASQSKFFDDGIKYVPEILNIVEKKAKSYYFHRIDGNHHLHMDSPEKIVELYLDFVKKIK